MARKAEPKPPKVDLFGEKWLPPKDPRGRKAHVRSEEVAEFVAINLASGLSVEDLEPLLHLSAPTIRKYYFREIDHHQTLLRAGVNMTAWRKALAGDMQAIKFIDKMLTQEEIKSPKGRRPAAPVKAPRLGKKAQADLDANAAHVGTTWGGLLPH